MPDRTVFVSYSTRDQAAATTIYRALTAQGVACWMAPGDIPPGTAWDDAIVAAIDVTSVVLLLLSAHADASSEVRKEIALAAGRRLPILPVRLENVAPTGSLAYHLVRAQWFDAFPPPIEPVLPRLADAVRALLGERGGAAPTPVPAPVPARSRLPAPATPLIGRETEVATVRARFGDDTVRLVTLTGPGGVGKTRLALEVAARSAALFPDGVVFVPLSALTEPALVLPTMAQALELPEVAGRTALQRLTDALRDRACLLVLDNFEQVLAARDGVAALLRDCPRLKLLVTSRTRLQLRAEHEMVVAPLPTPDPQHLPDPAGLTQYAAVALFADRARAIKPDFALTDEVAPAVAEICHRLDGLPLAIELVASRSKLLAPAALLARLPRLVASASGGPHDLEARQRTLRDTIAWSYHLLADPEQVLCRRFGVFAGGATLEAAETVCDGGPGVGGQGSGEDDGAGRSDAALAAPAPRPPAAGPLDVLDGLSALVDQSLVLLEAPPAGEAADEPRFRMLLTIRDFALAELVEHGEADQLRRHHADCYLALVERAEAGLAGAEQRRWLDRLEREHDNLRAVLAWARQDRAATELGLRLASALHLFWERRGHVAEGRRWLDDLLAIEVELPPAVRAKALNVAGNMAYAQGDSARAEALYEASLALHRAIDHRRGTAASLSNLGGVARRLGDYARAEQLQTEALALRRELGERAHTASALNNLANTVHARRDYARAQALHTESLALRRELGDAAGIAASIFNLGVLAWEGMDLARAEELFTQSLALRRQLGDQPGIAASLNSLANTLAAQGRDRPRAKALFEESLALHRALGDRGGVAILLNNLGLVAQAEGDVEGAESLLAEGLALHRELGNRAFVAGALNNLAVLALARPDLDLARARHLESLDLMRQLGDRLGLAQCLTGLAQVAVARQRPLPAARALGAAEAIYQAAGFTAPPHEQADVDRLIATLRAALGDAALDATRAAGAQLTLAAAVAEATAASASEQLPGAEPPG